MNDSDPDVVSRLKVQAQGVNAITHQAAQGRVNKPMTGNSGQASKARADDAHMKMSTPTRCAGMTGVQGAVVADLKGQHRIKPRAQALLHLGQKMHAHAVGSFM
jgi:hypothetical protein